MDELTENQIKIITKKINSNPSYKFLRESMEIIGNDERFSILNLLKNKPCLLSDIEQNMDKNQPTIAHHVRILEEHEFIHSSKKGKFKEYSISKKKFTKLLEVWNQWFNVIRSKNY